MSDSDLPILTAEQRELFARRLAELNADPARAVTWEQIKERIMARTGRPHPPTGGPR